MYVGVIISAPLCVNTRLLLNCNKNNWTNTVNLLKVCKLRHIVSVACSPNWGTLHPCCCSFFLLWTTSFLSLMCACLWLCLKYWSKSNSDWIFYLNLMQIRFLKVLSEYTNLIFIDWIWGTLYIVLHHRFMVIQLWREQSDRNSCNVRPLCHQSSNTATE